MYNNTNIDPKVGRPQTLTFTITWLCNNYPLYHRWLD